VIAARGFLPDLILMDVLMPGIEGGDLASEIRSVPAFRALPIVFLTGNAATESEIYEHGGYIGGERFLHKPVALQDLINCINQELQKSAHQPVEQKPAEDSNPHFAY
jgi:putative two-component system response regulator